MYGFNAREEYGCDFPGCDEFYRRDPSAKVAIRKDGQVLAFCHAHADQLIADGVHLKTLHDIHEEKSQKEERAKQQERQHDLDGQREDFLTALKRIP